MTVSRRTLAGIVIGGAAALAGCSSSAGLAEGTVVLDVRTPAEYKAGHLQGAQNIDIEAADFQNRISKLDKAATYFVYCHSGNRAGQAITIMKSMGFTKLTNGMGIDAASKTSGLPIVT